ncbi:MAG: TetR/AcrR family transcriptional regulator [Acidimicrobiia bacterium]|jgi:AcrR family transcriptional regulator
MFSEPFPEPAQASARPLRFPGPGERPVVAERAEQLVEAARDLANERQSAGFTVHEVAARAGSSLKGFYRCFAGKDDLLVALLAEDSRIGAEIFAERVDAHATHADRIRAAVTGLFELCTLPGAEGYTRVLVSEHRRLSQERPDDLRAALAPIVAVIEHAIDGAARVGAVESADPARDAATVFSLVLDGIHDLSFERVEPRDRAEYLWQFCGRALRVSHSAPISHAPPKEEP